jgi:hypothetical protein
LAVPPARLVFFISNVEPIEIEYVEKNVVVEGRDK